MNPREIMTRLKFISKIKVGDKINTRNHLSIQHNNFLTRISRTIYLQDSRTNALLFISETINCATEHIEKIKHTEKNMELNLLNTMLNDLRNSKTGIKNLCETYIDDLIIVSNFETILENVDFVLSDFNEEDIEEEEKVVSRQSSNMFEEE